MTIHIKGKAPKARVQVVTPKGGAMRDRRNRRSKDARKSWKNEQWGYTLYELIISLSFLTILVLLLVVVIHFIAKFW
jgi:hypothetical protein